MHPIKLLWCLKELTQNCQIYRLKNIYCTNKWKYTLCLVLCIEATGNSLFVPECPFPSSFSFSQDTGVLQETRPDSLREVRFPHRVVPRACDYHSTLCGNLFVFLSTPMSL